MSWTFEGGSRWSRFQELAAEVWYSQDMGSSAFRELCGFGGSDWGCGIPESDRYNARKMIEHAREAFFRAERWNYSESRPA